jgi:hypothetical protein
VTPLDLQNGPDGVRLTDGASTIDVVGWGEPLFSEYYEGLPAEDVPSGSSLARSPDCFDNDDNSVDFVSSVPTPGTRNSQQHDLSLSIRHAGSRVFDSGSDVEVSCVARNVGAVATGGEPVTLRVWKSGSGSPEAPLTTITATGDVAPRDSLEAVLLWRAPPSGYHRLCVELEYADDSVLSNNRRETSVTVGGVGWAAALNEVMHSPEEGTTEWVELVGVSEETLDLEGWALGDDEDAGAVAPASDSLPALPPGEFLLIARDADLLEPYASSTVLHTEDWEALSSDDTVVLFDGFGTILDRVTYERSWGGERGVSLERVRADMPPDDPGNWGASVAPTGSTPGRTNSIHLGSAPAEGRLTVTPNPFTPNGDGESDRAVVRFEVPAARATVRVSVFDLEGRLRALLTDHSAFSSTGELLWDGKDTEGDTLPSGLYIVYLEAIDARAGVFVTAKTAVGIVR